MNTVINDRAIDAANLLAAIADEFLYACLLLMLGEAPGYEQFCRELVARPGQPEEAQHCLEIARQLMAQSRPKNLDEQGLLAAPDWIELNVLLREAEALLQSPPMPLHSQSNLA